jgi:ferric-dicitrate binding protein FerR (iron transport regulator)
MQQSEAPRCIQLPWKRAELFGSFMMSRWARYRVVAAALLAMAAPVCNAADVELSATNTTAGADPSVTSYSGNVTLKVPAGTQVQLRAKAMKRERGLEIVRGEVEIKVDTLVVRTQQASIERNDKFTVVKMDAAEVSNVKP